MTDKPDDKIFDSLLEEMLTNQHPPDLTELIQQRARQEFGTHSLRVRAASLAANQSDNQRMIWWLSFGLAAALLLAAGAWFMVSADRDQPGGQLANEPGKLTQPLDQTQVASGQSIKERGPIQGVSNQASPDAAPTIARAAQDLPLDNLPFNTQNKNVQPIEPSMARQDNSVQAWKDEVVVSWLDNQFAGLWKKQLVNEPILAQQNELAQRIALTLAAQPTALAEQNPRALAQRLVRTATFAETISDRVVAYWLRGTPAADPKSEQGAALRGFIAQQIVAGKAWNETVAALVSSQNGQPAANFLAALAGGDNHRLTSRFSSALLDESLGCARCHDASENGKVISTDQDEYWSLVGLLTGLDTQVVKLENGKSTRQLVDRQSQLFGEGKEPNVFFHRPDGRLQAARFRLPNGDSWRTIEGAQTPRQALARWIATSPVTDQAAVNLAWRFVFGRPLVAEHAALDGEGYEDRREILRTLAVQFGAHGRDMGRLVEWMVSSKPFAVRDLDVDKQKWLMASEGELAAWNRSARNFAAFVPRSTITENSRGLATVETALVSVMKWSGSNDDRRKTLAQPVSPAPNKRPPAIKNDAKIESDPPPMYLLRSAMDDKMQNEFVTRLTASKLEWYQQVDHVAGLVGEASGNARLYRAADQLLETCGGDRQAALRQLLQSVWLCHEAI